MSTYKKEVGTAVQNFAGNYPGAVEGELWYDSTNKDFKYQYPNISTAGSWRTGNSLNTARNGMGGAGIYTSAIAFGGATPSVTAVVELYDGTSWTETTDLNTARGGVGGTGTQTSSLAFGGETTVPTGATESWNGSSWTELTDLNTARA